MSVYYCENCDNFIDLDEDVEHPDMCGTPDTEIPEGESVNDREISDDQEMHDFHCRQYELDRYQSASGDYSDLSRI